MKAEESEEDFYASLGLDPGQVFDLITAHHHPSPEQLMLISDKLGHSIDVLMRRDLASLPSPAHNLRMLVVDVDGVMTDGGMYYLDSGIEMKKYNAKDGLALMRLGKNGILTGMLSHGFNRTLIKQRAEMLGVSHHYCGQDKKAVVLAQWMTKNGLDLSQIAYIGDDINDLDVIRQVGFSATPSDGAPAVKKEVHLVLTARGGEGCVRELAELLFPACFR